jgi:predicted O-methyltransferase YrrM
MNQLSSIWSKTQDYYNPEHSEIFDQTKDIPGWQLPGDSYKLYEMGYLAGDVILEIGTYGGRSAVVELRGALANPERTTKPQFYGIDIDLHSVWRTYNSLEKAELTDYALVYYGNLQTFMADFPIQPTMVFVDGDHRYEGVKKDLNSLSDMLTPGVPVLCHDYCNPENDTGEYGVRQAVTEWATDGYAELVGTFGCSALLVTTEKCRGVEQIGHTPEQFAQQRAKVLQSYCHHLYNTLQISESDRAARLDGIHQLQRQLQELQMTDEQIRTQLQQTQAELGRLQAMIEAMKTSKFWKLRTSWFRLKKVIGLPID